MRKSSQSARIFKVSYADSSGLNELSARVIGCAFTVLNTLGAGSLEKVYEYSLAYEVRAASPPAVQQFGAMAHCKDILAGEYCVDLLISDVLLVELKTSQSTGRRAHAPGRVSRAVECNAPII